MEIGWRSCVRNGGRPDFIEAGSTFIDGFRNFMLKTFGRIDFDAVSERQIEGGTKMLSFHGVTIMWNPEFSDLDTLYAPSTAWEKRCYFINGRHAKLRPIDGQDMVTRKPPRAYDRYEYYWGITWRGALSMNRRNAQAVSRSPDRILLAAVALAGLMEEAEATASSGGTATEKVPESPASPEAEKTDTAPNVADTSGDTAGQPAGQHLDVAAKGDEPAPVQAAAAEPTGDEYADACKAGTPRIALVGKYSDRVPVQLKSKGHLAELEAAHPGSVEVQP
jgi:hypothetical protein